MGEIVLAVDLGGTNLRMAAVDRGGNILHRSRCATPRSDDPLDIIREISDLVSECRRETDAIGPVDTLGVAVPATMDIAHGIIHYAPNLPMLNGMHFSESLKSQIGMRILLENDATAAAIGEHWLGASSDVANSICVTLGTGVGGGIILNNQALRGPDGTAGELGHVCVEPDGHPCGCGSWGCLEQYASATAVVRIASELSRADKSSTLAGKGRFTSEDVYNAALEGDAVASEAFRRMGYYLGIVLAGVVNLLDPEIVVLGGGLSAAWDLFIEHTRDQISKRAFPEPAGRAKLVRARLGDDAGILGVASLAFAAPQQGILVN
jgi:glucokinase